ncbi:SRPBCC family protein [Amycolatopsis orientalis]|uniref:SRPBCC family protein n=1 Tax=Amycolatopsis orientalis TaxID=31958 RepID=UPI0003A973E7|nr:SRPBCC family protein [Amycolatopsis orientalis]
MELQHTFRVPAPIEQAWAALLDVDQVAGCLPGATLTSYDGETFAATVKVKIGAIQLSYGGQGRFVEQDPDAHRVVIEAAGKERRGGGTAAATVTCRLEADGSSTAATVRTDLTITGKPAQFGRGAIEDISGKIIAQFAQNLSARMAAPVSPPDTPPDTQPEPLPENDDALDLLALTSPVIKRNAAAAGVLVIALLLIAVLRRRR